MRPQLGELAFFEVRETLVKFPRYGKTENTVTEEFEALVRLRSRFSPRRMSEDALGLALRKRVDQLGQLANR